MKKLFQTIFVSALSILLFTMPAFAAAPEPEEIPVVAPICSGDSMGRSPCRRGAGQRPAGGWRTGYGERPGTGWIDPCGVPDPPQR